MKSYYRNQVLKNLFKKAVIAPDEVCMYIWWVCICAYACDVYVFVCAHDVFVYTCVCVYMMCIVCVVCMCVHLLSLENNLRDQSSPSTLFEIESIAVCHSMCQATQTLACRDFPVAISRLAFRKTGITEAQYCVWLYTVTPALGLPHSAWWLLTVNSNKH